MHAHTLLSDTQSETQTAALSMHREELHDGRLPSLPYRSLPYRLSEDTILLYRTGHREGVCRLRLFLPASPVTAEAPAVVIATELLENRRLSVTNGIEIIAAEVCAGYGLNPRHTVLIEHYDDRENGCAARLPGRVEGEKFSCVTFGEMRALDTKPPTYQVRRPQWRTLAKVEVELLLECAFP